MSVSEEGGRVKSVTQELREWAGGGTLRAGMSWRTARDQALAIADRIDAEHEAKVAYWQGASYKDGYDEGFASADDWLAQHEDAMAEHGWVKLPVDADGETIHIGDVMEWCDSGETLTVEGIGSDALFYIDGENAEWTAARNKRHHVPTVEDVLREFTDAILEWSGKSGTVAEVGTWSDVAADFAAKLQLRGDGE